MSEQNVASARGESDRREGGFSSQGGAFEGRRLMALIIVGVLHVVIGYAFISGLALKAVKVITQPMDTFEVPEPEEPIEEPPPPTQVLEEIPPYVPPPEVVIAELPPPPPTITTQTVVQTPDPPRVITQPAPETPAIAAPAPREIVRKAATPKGRLGASISADDYPPASLRAEEEGSVQVRYDINVEGRAENCQVVKSSGHRRLDDRTCELVERRFRFNPATEDGQPVRDSRTQAFRWEIPEY